MSLAYFTRRHRYWASWNRRTRRMSSVLQDTVTAGLTLSLGPPPSRGPRPAPPAPRLPLPGEHGPEDHLRAERGGVRTAANGKPRLHPVPVRALVPAAP